MTIRIVYKDDKERKLTDIIHYDFYPETKLIFADCGDAVYYVPIMEDAIIEIFGETERGYLEGHDEAR